MPLGALIEVSTRAQSDRAISEHDAAPFLRLVEMLVAGAGQKPAARDAPHLAALMAHSARLVRGIVRDRLITLAIADGSEAADVGYQDSWRDGLFSRRAKLDWLEERAETGTPSDAVTVARDLLDNMRPMPFGNREFLSLCECSGDIILCNTTDGLRRLISFRGHLQERGR